MLFRPDVAAADAALAPLVTAETVAAALALVPDERLDGEPGFDTPDDVRAAFAAWFEARMQTPHVWLPEVAR